jgi:hypothetical protein
VVCEREEEQDDEGGGGEWGKSKTEGIEGRCSYSRRSIGIGWRAALFARITGCQRLMLTYTPRYIPGTHYAFRPSLRLTRKYKLGRPELNFFYLVFLTLFPRNKPFLAPELSLYLSPALLSPSFSAPDIRSRLSLPA